MKLRGEVFFPCTRCESLNVFGLVENYGYGQLYGVRIAKYKTNRLMLCSQCQDGYGLSKEQWVEAMAVSDGLKPRLDSLSLRAMASSSVDLARRVFPDMAADVRELLAEQLGEAPALAPAQAAALPPATSAPVTPVRPQPSATSGPIKTCPECAETIKAAARKCRFCGHRFDTA